jgi:proline dehydrogenase
VLKTITAVWNVLDILFTGRKTKADERLHRAVMNTALVILSQFTARNIHEIIKLVSLFIRTDNPDSPVR